MSDLIDRLREYASTRKGELADLITEAADALERPTCEDVVNRQQAIDALDPLFESLAIDKIKALPTAQPDVIRCKDCRFQDKGRNESESWNLCGYRPWLHVPTEDEHYCGYAERRIDEQTD